MNNNNNNVDGDILKHLASLPSSLLVLLSFHPFLHSFLVPSLPPSCALVTLVILLCLRVSVVLPNAAHVLLSRSLEKYQSRTFLFYLFQRLCSHA